MLPNDGVACTCRLGQSAGEPSDKRGRVDWPRLRCHDSPIFTRPFFNRIGQTRPWGGRWLLSGSAKAALERTSVDGSNVREGDIIAL